MCLYNFFFFIIWNNYLNKTWCYSISLLNATFSLSLCRILIHTRCDYDNFSLLNSHLFFFFCICNYYFTWFHNAIRIITIIDESVCCRNIFFFWCVSNKNWWIYFRIRNNYMNRLLIVIIYYNFLRNLIVDYHNSIFFI